MRSSIPASATAERGAGPRRRLRFAVAAVPLVLLIAAALAAPAWLPSPFAVTNPPLHPPSIRYPFGTDNLGRDVLSGVVYGARASLLLALLVIVQTASIGALIGSTTGYFGGWIDEIGMRITEVFQTIPRFFLAIVVIALFGPGIDRLAMVLGTTSWPELARLIRGEVLSYRQTEYVTAARALGAGTGAILRRHVLPQTVPVVLSYLGLLASQALLMEAALGFIGLGDPATMTWGLLVGQARAYLRAGWWLAVFPGAVITIAVLSVNLLVDLPGRRRPTPVL